MGVANGSEVRDLGGPGSHTYHRAFDPRGNDSLAKVARRIARGSVVLDVGCGPGVLSRYLAEEKECVVDAIDFDTDLY
jgi:2-polyprenyl-3-methyl-5-hydroxy-6-metoxy-1,4-benzoquinol methylase